MDLSVEGELNQSPVARYEALLMVSKAISTHHNLLELFGAIQSELRRVAHFDGMVITQNGPEPGAVIWHVAEFQRNPIEQMPRQLSEGDIARWVFENQQPVVIHSLEEERRFPAILERLRQSGVHSFCMFPLTTARRRVGTIGLASAHQDAYGNEDLRFLSSVADQTALAIDAALNLAEIQTVEADLRQSRERLQLLLNVNNSVVSNLELRELLRTVLSNIRSAVQCDLAGIALPLPGNQRLHGYTLDFPGGKGIFQEGGLLPEAIQQVFDTGIPATHSSSDLTFQGSPAQREGIQSSCHVPLTGRNRRMGVLAAGRREHIPFTPQDLQLLSEIGIQVAIAIQNALAYQEIEQLKEQLSREKVYLENEIRSELNFEEIVGRSEALARVLRQVETVAPTDSTVVIYGETGTGKELIARSLHALSSRSKKPFVKLNCAAIPAGLLESELFGHEKGAFTGAVSQRIGRFELASQGTVFLDEIGELPLELQPKLLRVLQEGEFERVGSSLTMRTNARLIAATNRNLLAMVEERNFRADLYYRLNVFPLHVPLLRERREDIPLLVRHFVQHYARRMNRTIETIPSETMTALAQYSWPGNIRELQNLMERAVILSSGPVLQVPLNDLRAQPAVLVGTAEIDTMDESERRHILHALEASNWVVAGPKGAASLLGLKRSTLQARMAKHGISRARAPR